MCLPRAQQIVTAGRYHWRAPLQSGVPMPFAFYARLSAKDQAVYGRSDTVTSLALPGAETLRPAVEALRTALQAEERRAVEEAAAAVAAGLLQRLGVPPVSLSVLAVRPSSSWGELHGLYTREPRRVARIQLWMRTVHHKRVVAFRTFLRTLLHEVGHHLDYELLRLPDSFHTEGFFRRESSLFRQLVPAARGPAQRALPLPPARPPPGRRG
jgi:hypothetical protein